ncbi:MAG: CBS domain-containing protein [Gammaproteobacteria bacterium]|nr:CBS domain-containing protein [Gammaproteobacteria bacterium]
MKKNELITHIMSADIISVKHGDSISTARQLMEKNCIHHLPVVSGAKLIGLISMNDIMRVSFSNVFVEPSQSADQALDHSTTIEEVMTEEVVTVKEKDTVRHAAEMLSTSNYNCLPVVNEAHELQGIVSDKDLIGYLLDQY